MTDSFYPEINYLRISITDRCNLQCFYCTPWGDWEKLPAPEILRYEELLRLVQVAVGTGLCKVRVTGGEPLMRRGVVDFIRGLHSIPGLEEVCLTTNGVLLEELAPALHATGLDHLNLSLDTLRRDRYRQLTGRDNLPEVLAGLRRAVSLGFRLLKINCVVLKDINDDEILDFALLAREHPYQVRFIEFMPTGQQKDWTRHFLPMAEVRRKLEGLGAMQEVDKCVTAGPARIFRLPGFRGELGFISSISDHHCPTCNRLRITAAGRLRPCLFGALELDLKGPLRQGASDQALRQIFAEAIRLKSASGGLSRLHAPTSCRSMVSIGG